MKEITKLIHKKHEETFNIRAKYLFHFVRDCVGTLKSKKRLLDVGCGKGSNLVVFGKEFKEKYGIEYSENDYTHCKKKLPHKDYFISKQDAKNLNFKNNFFDMILAISVLEHINQYEITLKEMERVLNKEGVIFIQIPNKHFFVDLHTGIPFLYYIPKKIRKAFLKFMGYSQGDFKKIEIPTPNELIFNAKEAQLDLVRMCKSNYHIKMIPAIFRPAYYILRIMGILNLFPMGYIFLFRKAKK